MSGDSFFKTIGNDPFFEFFGYTWDEYLMRIEQIKRKNEEKTQKEKRKIQSSPVYQELLELANEWVNAISSRGGIYRIVYDTNDFKSWRAGYNTSPILGYWLSIWRVPKPEKLVTKFLIEHTMLDDYNNPYWLPTVFHKWIKKRFKSMMERGIQEVTQMRKKTSKRIFYNRRRRERYHHRKKLIKKVGGDPEKSFFQTLKIASLEISHDNNQRRKLI